MRRVYSSLIGRRFEKNPDRENTYVLMWRQCNFFFLSAVSVVIMTPTNITALGDVVEAVWKQLWHLRATLVVPQSNVRKQMFKN